MSETETQYLFANMHESAQQHTTGSRATAGRTNRRRERGGRRRSTGLSINGVRGKRSDKAKFMAMVILSGLSVFTGLFLIIQAPTTVNSIVGFVLIAAGWLLLCSVVCYNFFKHHKAEKRRKEGYVAISGSSATAMNHHRQQQQQQCQHQHQHQHQPPYRYNQREAVLVNTHSLEPINHSNTNHDNPNTQHSYSSSGVSASGDYHSIDMDAHPGILSFSVGSDGGSDAGNSDSWSSEGYGIDSFNVGYTSPDLDLRRHNTSPGNMKVPFVTDARTHGLGQTDARSHSPLPPAYSAAIIATHDSPAVFHALAAQEGDVPPYMLQHTASAQN